MSSHVPNPLASLLGNQANENVQVNLAANIDPRSQQGGPDFCSKSESESESDSNSNSCGEPPTPVAADKRVKDAEHNSPPRKRCRVTEDSRLPPATILPAVQSRLSTEARKRRNARNRRREKRRRIETQAVKQCRSQRPPHNSKKSELLPSCGYDEQVNATYIYFLLSSVTSVVTTSRKFGWSEHAYGRVLFLLDEARRQAQPSAHSTHDVRGQAVKELRNDRDEAVRSTQIANQKLSADDVDQRVPNRKFRTNDHEEESKEQPASKKQVDGRMGGTSRENQSRTVDASGGNRNNAPVQCANPQFVDVEVVPSTDVTDKIAKDRLLELKKSLIVSLNMDENQNHENTTAKCIDANLEALGHPKRSNPLTENYQSYSPGRESEREGHVQKRRKRKLNCHTNSGGDSIENIRSLETDIVPPTEGKASKQLACKKSGAFDHDIDCYPVATKRRSEKRIFDVDTICAKKGSEVNPTRHPAKKTKSVKRNERPGSTSISAILDIARRTGALQSSKQAMDSESEQTLKVECKQVQELNGGTDINANVILVKEPLDERIRLYKKAVEERCTSYSVFLKKADTSPQKSESLGDVVVANHDPRFTEVENKERSLDSGF